jgi:hypothetical protein
MRREEVAVISLEEFNVHGDVRNLRGVRVMHAACPSGSAMWTGTRALGRNCLIATEQERSIQAKEG